jgi:hypothetical protein
MTKKQKATKPNASKTRNRSAKKRPTTPKRSKTVERFDWRGISVSVAYEADWLGMSKELSQFATAHLEIRSEEPSNAALPVTETGYRSHFIARGAVEQTGGPVAYARAWLDDAAKTPAWKRRQEASRQLSLF